MAAHAPNCLNDFEILELLHSVSIIHIKQRKVSEISMAGFYLTLLFVVKEKSLFVLERDIQYL